MSTSSQTPDLDAPDYGEPWHPSVLSDYYVDTSLRPKQFEGSARRRAITCVNACAGMEDPAAEIAEIRAYAQRCKEGCIALSHSIDRIDYACGEPNDMQVSDYCVHQNDEAVVERVKSKLAEIQAMRDAIKGAHEALADVENRSRDFEESHCPYALTSYLQSVANAALVKLKPFATP